MKTLESICWAGLIIASAAALVIAFVYPFVA